jgi:alkylation response protein AidB-like acyl-CoA dehydrogenase
MSGLNTERLVLSGGPIGLMQAAMDIALPYVRERKQFGQAIGTFGIMQAKIADMYTALQSSRAFAYQVARDYDAGHKSAHRRRQLPAACLGSRGTGGAGRPSRPSAATATSTNTPPAACCAMPSSTPSAPAPTKSAAC